jgi:hypothetical protein
MKIMLAFTSLAPVGMLTAAPARAQQAKNIVDTAIAAGPFTTLANALTSADLVATLEGPGPFTVFAPTDEGFAKLPAGMLESLLKPEKKDKLRRILSVPAAGVVLSNVNMYDTSVVPSVGAGGGVQINLSDRFALQGGVEFKWQGDATDLDGLAGTGLESIMTRAGGGPCRSPAASPSGSSRCTTDRPS